MSWTKFHRSLTKSPRLRPGDINLFPHHFLGQYRIQHSYTALALEAQPQIQLIRWPGNSPHLNPIKTVWAWMKKQLKDHKCTNMEQWKAVVLLVWLQRTQEVDFLKKLVGGMPKGVQELIAGEGGMIRL
jgi:hypothetical protein